jgi:hypothetical protein
MGEILYVMPETRQQGVGRATVQCSTEMVIGIINQNTAYSPYDGYLGATS